MRLAALAAHRRVAAHDLAQAGRIDVRHVGQVQQDLGLAAVHQPRHRVAQRVVAFADQDLSVQVQDDDVTDLRSTIFMRSFSLLRQSVTRNRHAITRIPRLSIAGAVNEVAGDSGSVRAFHGRRSSGSTPRARGRAAHIVLPEGTEPRTVAGGGPRRRARASPASRCSGRRTRSCGAARETGVRPRRRRVAAAARPAARRRRPLRAYLERVGAAAASRPTRRARTSRTRCCGRALGVAAGRFDGMVAGARSTTADTLRAALRGIGVRAGRHEDLVVHADGDRRAPSWATAGCWCSRTAA